MKVEEEVEGCERRRRRRRVECFEGEMKYWFRRETR